MSARSLFSLLLLGLTALPASAESLKLKEVRQIAAKIDQLVEADLKEAKLPANPIVSDDVFLRRAYLGIVGRIPTPQEAMGFLDNKSPNKRAELIEALVASPGYDSASFNYFADLLRVQSTREKYGLGWHVWLRESLAADKPWDDIVREMLSAEGHAAKNPAVGYYLRDRGMLLDNVSNTMQVFLGHQIGCAQCHDHPFDRWTQMEYYELAAFSSDIEYRSQEQRDLVGRIIEDMRKDAPKSRPNFKGKAKDKKKAFQQARAKRMEQQARTRKLAQGFRPVFRDFSRNEISSNPSKPIKLPADYAYEDGQPGEAIPPATLFGEELHNLAPEKRREAFADWVVSGNEYFAKVFANRLWDRTFGHGLVDPVDNWSKESETAHPEVLAYLEEVMQRVDFRTRDFERILYHTRLFQRAAAAQEAAPGTALTFQGPQLRRMRAEELYDSVLVLTFGNVDDNINDSLASRWEEYTGSITDLLTSSTPDLLELRDELVEVEKKQLEYQRKSRELNLKIQQATKAGRQGEVARLRREMFEMRRSYRDRQEGPSMASMVAMRNLRGGTRPRLNMRASEHPTPFNGDHLVRQFGGSDRQIPESSQSHASVPQALTLLNGRIATTTENRNSKTFEALAEISNAETRLDYLFLAYYAAYPTAEETRQFLPLAEDKDGLFSLARAMLTSKRFLFVQ